MEKEWMNGNREKNRLGITKLHGYVLAVFIGFFIIMMVSNVAVAMEIAAISLLTTLSHVIMGNIKYE